MHAEKWQGLIIKGVGSVKSKKMTFLFYFTDRVTLKPMYNAYRVNLEREKKYQLASIQAHSNHPWWPHYGQFSWLSQGMQCFTDPLTPLCFLTDDSCNMLMECVWMHWSWYHLRHKTNYHKLVTTDAKCHFLSISFALRTLQWYTRVPGNNFKLPFSPTAFNRDT